MYRVILVDDEDIEREAMAALIPWEAMGLKLVDMAWNGIEALEKIKIQKPDIVITDIMMPVMNGIELIRCAQELYPDMAFLVLSGYGEYEYTSQAMELGIRHYILKPCDEEKFVEVLTRVREELSESRKQRASDQEYQSTLIRALSHAKDQILSSLITMKELSKSDELLLEKFTSGADQEYVMLSVRSEAEFEQLDRFVVTNILMELLGKEQMFMNTAFPSELVYLLSLKADGNMEKLAGKMHREFYKYKKMPLRSAVSSPGGLRDTYRLYEQIRELYRLGELEEKREFFSSDLLDGSTEALLLAVDYVRLRSAHSFAEILFEVYASYAKMDVSGFGLDKMKAAFQRALEILYGHSESVFCSADTVWGLLRKVTEECVFRQLPEYRRDKENIRVENILYAIYENIRNPELSLQFLAKEVLFMNEDYFGRLFYRNMHEKYSIFLVRIRVSLAQRIMEYHPNIRIAELAEQTGYAPDGQYFAKVFKKHTGMAPSDYRKGLMEREKSVFSR